MLFQFVDEMNPGSGAVIVNANCTRFKESPLRFSPIEGIALDFVISCCSYWISYCLKKAAVYKKELEVRDPLVEKLGEIGEQDFEYITLLQNFENRTEFKHLP